MCLELAHSPTCAPWCSFLSASILTVLSVFLIVPSSQEFSLQRMDSLVDDRVNILGFSIFNQSHAFFQEFSQSLNQSWQENCDHVPFTGPAVSVLQMLSGPNTLCGLPHIPYNEAGPKSLASKMRHGRGG